MFAKFKYNMAKSQILLEMRDRSLISKEKSDAMALITEQTLVRKLGAAVIETGKARNRFEAAAIVFARLAIVSENSPNVIDECTVTDEDWQNATRFALVHAGMSSSVDDKGNLSFTAAYIEAIRENWEAIQQPAR